MTLNLIGRLATLSLTLAVSTAFSRSAQLPPNPADLVLWKGTIATVDEKLPEVEALAVQGDRIMAVGSNEEIEAYIGPKTKVIDLKGAFAMPGFIEGHGHFTWLGHEQTELDLRGAANWSEIVSIVEEAASKAPPGEWILGSGWHQEKWDAPPSSDVEGYPLHHALSKASPDNPVLLTHGSRHAAFANAKAMELAGIAGINQDPPGGEILRDADGNPTGVFLDTAEALIRQAHEDYRSGRKPQEIEAEERKAIQLAAKACLQNGITTFHDAGSSFHTIDRFKETVEEGKLGVRLWVMIREDHEALARHLTNYRTIDAGKGMLTVRAIKMFMDGALGSRSAWMFEPYADLPGSTGLNVDTVDRVTSVARLAMENGFQMCVHAIGDRANREALDIFEKVLRENPHQRDHRWRIEHAQHLDNKEIPRFAQLGVTASIQTVHATSDAPFVAKRLGAERAEEGAYVWRKLIESGAMVGNGTDAPIEGINPIANFYAAITRKLPDGSAFYPAQRMSRDEALRASTINNAYAAFEENTKGSLTPGKLADITVLSRNILTVPEKEIQDTEVLYTIVGGKIVYDKQ